MLGLRRILSSANGMPSWAPMPVIRRSISSTVFGPPNFFSRYSFRSIPSLGMVGLSSNGFHSTLTVWVPLTAWMAFSSRRLPT